MNLQRAEPTVMVSPGAPSLGDRVRQETIYAEAGSFAPAVTANARVMARLVFGDPHDAWHFMFAPNRGSSTAAALAKSLRRARGWRGKVVQTIASAPRSFRHVQGLLFGDVIVAQSEHTRGRLIFAGVRANVRVIPPCAVAPRERTPGEIATVLDALDLPKNGQIVLYPGDIEVSTGARTVVDAARVVLAEVQDATFVLACRKKTARALVAEAELRERVRDLGERVRFVGDVTDMHALMCASHVVAMPADDLYGKVDLPLVVIEALALGKPLVLARGGPLESVHTARFVDPGSSSALAREIVRALGGEASVASEARAGVRLYEERFSPTVVARAYDDLYESG